MEKIGGRRAVTWGLLLLGLGTIMRGLWTTVFSLYLFTVLLSLGIALTQTTVPVLIRRWFPSHIGLVTALFTDGLIIGETIGAGATVPLMMRFLGNDAWPATFIFWGIPLVVLLAIWLWLAPPAPPMTEVLAPRPESLNAIDEVLELATAMRSKGRLAEAEQDYRTALSLQRQALGERHVDVAETLRILSNLLRQAWASHSSRSG